MTFRVNNDDSSITHLANKLRDIEDVEGKNLSSDARSVLNLSAHMLEQIRSQIISAIEEITKALSMRTGYSDSDSRQIEIARRKQLAIEEQVEFLKSLLAQRPPSSPKSRPPRSEVI